MLCDDTIVKNSYLLEWVPHNYNNKPCRWLQHNVATSTLQTTHTEKSGKPLCLPKRLLSERDIIGLKRMFRKCR